MLYDRLIRCRVALVAVLVSLLLASQADAGYDARRSEARGLLGKQKLAKAEHDAIARAFDAYFNQRSKCLEALAKIVKKSDKGEMAALWVARANMCHSGGAKSLGEALKGVKEPSAEAVKFVNEFRAVEDKFFRALLEVTVAEQRDVIVGLRLRIAEMTDILNKKWASIQASDKSIDARLEAATRKIDSQVSAVLRECASKHRTTSEKIAAFVKAAGDNPGRNPLDGKAGMAIEAARKSLGFLAGKWMGHKGRTLEFATVLADLRRQEVGVIMIFNEVREDTDDFLDKSDFKHAREAFKKATNSAHGLVGNSSTSGQKSDASAFRSELLDALSDHMEAAEDVWEDFVDEHKGKFFGPVAPNIEEALVEKRDTDRWRRQFRATGLQSKLNAWRGDAGRMMGVSTSGLTSEQRSALKKALQPLLDDYVDEMEDMIKAHDKAAKELEERNDLDDEIDD